MWQSWDCTFTVVDELRRCGSEHPYSANSGRALAEFGYDRTHQPFGIHPERARPDNNFSALYYSTGPCRIDAGIAPTRPSAAASSAHVDGLTRASAGEPFSADSCQWYLSQQPYLAFEVKRDIG